MEKASPGPGARQGPSTLLEIKEERGDAGTRGKAVPARARWFCHPAVGWGSGPAGLTRAPALEGNQLPKAAITLSSLPHWD